MSGAVGYLGCVPDAGLLPGGDLGVDGSAAG